MSELQMDVAVRCVSRQSNQDDAEGRYSSGNE
jgi:hypothetical protein